MGKIVTLNEGNTPLYECKNLAKTLGLKYLYVKYEGANPTGAFKDRGTMVEITKALEMGRRLYAAHQPVIWLLLSLLLRRRQGFRAM